MSPEIFRAYYYIMDIFRRYVEQQNKNYPLKIELPEIEASIFIVIPCYNEPDIITTINSLSKCHPPNSKVAVFIVVNSSEDSPEYVIVRNGKVIILILFLRSFNSI